MFSHGINKHKRSLNIILIILPGLLNRLSYSLQTCEVNAGIYFLLIKDSVYRVGIKGIGLIKCNLLPGDFFHPVKALFRSVYKIIDNDHIVSVFKQRYYCM